MIESRLLSAWDGFSGSAGLIAIIVLAFCVMVRAVKVGDLPRYLGAIVFITILLLILPAILLGLWNTMSMKQHVAIIALCIALVLIFGAMRRRSRDTRRR